MTMSQCWIYRELWRVLRAERVEVAKLSLQQRQVGTSWTHERRSLTQILQQSAELVLVRVRVSERYRMPLTWLLLKDDAGCDKVSSPRSRCLLGLLTSFNTEVLNNGDSSRLNWKRSACG